jgi:hypothetical protein
MGAGVLLVPVEWAGGLGRHSGVNNLDVGGMSDTVNGDCIHAHSILIPSTCDPACITVKTLLGGTTLTRTTAYRRSTCPSI